MRSISSALGFAVGLATALAVFLGVVYALMWLLTAVLEQPYAAASSTTFVLMSLALVINAALNWWRSDRKVQAGLFTIYAALSGPLLLVVAFNLHSYLTDPEITGGRYLPGEVLGLVAGSADWTARQAMALMPALGNIYEAMNSNWVLSAIGNSLLSGFVLIPLQRWLRQQWTRFFGQAADPSPA